MKNKNLKNEEENNNKKKKKETGFTLVELIVVITIIAILGTIAFISFTGYSQNSRDSKRIADINSIQKSLELYITEKGTYPIPDNNASITYSGATAWIEGTVGDGVIINIESINKKPIDPLTENEYTYSVTSSKTEYQLGAISEGGTIGYELPINQTHAATPKKGTAMIRGTYNEKYLKVQSGTINRILAIPSIIATDITETELLNILSSKKLVYNNYNNIPHSYNNAGYIMTGGFDYTNTNPQVYSGSMKTLTDSNDEKKIFISALKSAYNGTILQGEANYKDIVASDIDTNSTGAINTVISFINSNVGGIRVSNTVLPMLGVSGTSEPEPVQFLSNCTANGEIYYTDNSGNKLATVTNTGSATWESLKGPSDLTCTGHIIVCAGTNSGYTLQSCNLGSSLVGTGLTSYGYYYQWGNNGGTPYGTRTPNTTLVNASSYGPGTVNGYYNSTTFIGGISLASPYDWTSPQNHNLWGNELDTKEARKGPCLTGYHIPTHLEWAGIANSGGWGNNGPNIVNTLKMPLAGIRVRTNGTMDAYGENGVYWSSSTNSTYGYIMFISNTVIDPVASGSRARAFSLRCIKN